MSSFDTTRDTSQNTTSDTAGEAAGDAANSAGAGAGDRETKARVEDVIADGSGIREGIRALIVDMARTRKVDLEGLGELAAEVVRIASDAASRLGDEAEVLPRVFEGVGDGMATAATATRLSMEEAAARGKAYAASDLKQIASDLEALTDRFMAGVLQGMQSAEAEMTDQARAFRDHASRTAEAVKPSIRDAIAAARSDPRLLASETAQASASLTRQTAGVLLAAMSGLFQGASEMLLRDEAGRPASTTAANGESSTARGDGDATQAPVDDVADDASSDPPADADASRDA